MQKNKGFCLLRIYTPLIAVSISLTPIIFIILFRLYARNDNSSSLVVFFIPLYKT